MYSFIITNNKTLERTVLTGEYVNTDYWLLIKPSGEENVKAYDLDEYYFQII